MLTETLPPPSSFARNPSHSTYRQSAFSDAFDEELLSDDEVAKQNDEIPTYEADGGGTVHMAGTERFGRWRSWVEKRSRERHLGVEGLDDDEGDDDEPLPPHTDAEVNDPNPRSRLKVAHLLSTHLQPSTNRRTRPPSYFPDGFVSSPQPFSSFDVLPQSPLSAAPHPSASSSSTTTHLLPTHLSYQSFGPSTVPHSMSPINCLLPIMQDRYLLYGTMDGLSVMSACDSDDLGEAVCKPLITGVEFLHLEIMFIEPQPPESSGKTPKGWVIALVAVQDVSDDGEPVGEKREVRIYQLGSLASLARWVASNEHSSPIEDPSVAVMRGKLVDKMERMSSAREAWVARRLTKNGKVPEERLWKRSSGFSVRSLLSRSTSIDLVVSELNVSERRTSTTALAGPSSTAAEDLARRWAADYKLLSQHEKLLDKEAKETVLYLRLHRNRSNSSTYLATVTSKRFFIYRSTMEADRSFTLVNALDLPYPPVEVGFVPLRPNPAASVDPLSLYVSFGVKACLIGTLDSQVSEVKLRREGLKATAVAMTESKDRIPSGLTTRVMSESVKLSKKALRMGKGLETPPEQTFRNVTAISSSGDAGLVAVTKGTQTKIYPAPLSLPFSANTPCSSVAWDSPPDHVTAHSIGSRLHLIGFGSRQVIQVIEIETTIASPDDESDALALRKEVDGSSMQEQRADLCLGSESRGLALGNSVSKGSYGAVKRGANDWRICRFVAVL